MRGVFSGVAQASVSDWVGVGDPAGERAAILKRRPSSHEIRPARPVHEREQIMRPNPFDREHFHNVMTSPPLDTPLRTEGQACIDILKDLLPRCINRAKQLQGCMTVGDQGAEDFINILTDALTTLESIEDRFKDGEE